MKLKKIIALIALATMLAACATTKEIVVVKTVHTVVLPPQAMFECPVIKKYPKVETLTDGEVAKLLTELNRNNKTCKASIDAIEKYLKEAKRKIDGNS